MDKKFDIALPYRIEGKTDTEYSNDIRELVKYLRITGIKVFDLKETDILDEYNKPVEHIYVLECFGDSNRVSSIFGNSTTNANGRKLLFS